MVVVEELVQILVIYSSFLCLIMDLKEALSSSCECLKMAVAEREG